MPTRFRVLILSARGTDSRFHVEARQGLMCQQIPAPRPPRHTAWKIFQRCAVTFNMFLHTDKRNERKTERFRKCTMLRREGVEVLPRLIDSNYRHTSQGPMKRMTNAIATFVTISQSSNKTKAKAKSQHSFVSTSNTIPLPHYEALNSITLHRFRGLH